MTSSDIDPADRAGGTGRQILAQVLIYVGLGCVGGGLSAAIALGIEKGFSTTLLVVSGSIVLAGVAAIAAALKIGNFDPPSLRNKTGRSQIVLLVSVALGALLGMYGVITDVPDRLLDGTFAISNGEAIAAGVLLAAAFAVGLYWQGQIDEHDFASVKTACYWALSAYFYGYLAWLLAAAVQLAPAVDDFALFLGVAAVFTAVWHVKRAG